MEDALFSFPSPFASELFLVNDKIKLEKPKVVKMIRNIVFLQKKEDEFNTILTIKILVENLI
jgi:hypothetical protein